VDLLVDEVEDLVVIVKGEEFLSGGLFGVVSDRSQVWEMYVIRLRYLLELPDREHLGGWAAILAELNRDNARVDKDIEIETLASVEEEEPVGPDDGRSFAGAGDEGGRGVAGERRMARPSKATSGWLSQ
jgi:hypothetical protein